MPTGVAKSVDPDQQSDLHLHCLHMPFCQELWCTKFYLFFIFSENCVCIVLAQGWLTELIMHKNHLTDVWVLYLGDNCIQIWHLGR